MRRVSAAVEGIHRSRPRGYYRIRRSIGAPHCGRRGAMTYTVKEIFYTLQGEGAQSGRAAVFCRFSGCNLWSGREEDRSRAVCQFCDTDFVGVGPDGGRFSSAKELADAIDRCWGGGSGDAGGASGRQDKYVVCTGGEPLLQLDEKLIDALHERGFEVA